MCLRNYLNNQPLLLQNYPGGYPPPQQGYPPPQEAYPPPQQSYPTAPAPAPAQQSATTTIVVEQPAAQVFGQAPVQLPDGVSTKIKVLYLSLFLGYL